MSNNILTSPAYHFMPGNIYYGALHGDEDASSTTTAHEAQPVDEPRPCGDGDVAVPLVLTIVTIVVAAMIIIAGNHLGD